METEVKYSSATDASEEGKECCEDQNEEELFARLDEIIDDFSGMEGSLIPILQTVQNLFGYLPERALKKISDKLHIPYSEVTGVVTFYSYFSTVPRGKNIVRVCLGTACYVRGGKEVLASLKDALGIDVGGTTEDRLFSLEVGRCFGACGLAPVVLVNDDVHQRVKPAKIKDILEQYKPAEENSEGDE